MFALVDCNNFYVSCHRVFEPQYNGRPVVVLSNNDGCAIARSEEAKAIGIEMAVPVHLIEDIVQKHQVKLYSSNYTLYGDMSSRVMHTLSQFTPHMEIYSIDEAFLLLEGFIYADLTDYAKKIKGTVTQHTGIPVSIGVAPSKTLAKLANRYAKKTRRQEGVYVIDSKEKREEVLRWAAMGDIWGIGRQYEKKLKDMGLHNAYDFTALPEEWIRREMSVVGQRMYQELKGVSCIPLEELPQPKKVICTSRSFGTLLTDLKDIKEAVATFAGRCAFKLRHQASCAGTIQVFLQTNVFRQQDRQYHRQITIQLQRATSSTVLLTLEALKGLDKLYRKGYNFHKAGVIAMDIVPQTAVQGAFFDQRDHSKEQKLMQTVDAVNYYIGADIVQIASQGYSRKWHLKTQYRSPCYTTRFEDIPVIRM